MARYSWLGLCRRHFLSSSAVESAMEGSDGLRIVSTLHRAVFHDRLLHSCSYAIWKCSDFTAAELPSVKSKRFIHATGTCNAKEPNYYEVLGVTEDASRDEIKKAYHSGQPDDIKDSAILGGYRCRNDKCSGFLLRDSDNKGFLCQQCGLFRSKADVKKIASGIREISERAPKWTTSGNVDGAGRLERSSVILQINHPCIPKLLGETEAAIKSLTKAMDILRIAHGRDAPFMKELMMKLKEARAEAPYRLQSKDDDDLMVTS